MENSNRGADRSYNPFRCPPAHPSFLRFRPALLQSVARRSPRAFHPPTVPPIDTREAPMSAKHLDRKSTRLNSSHGYISYAVFCLKKKNNHSDATQADSYDTC